jgi:hypothetical protein
MHDQAYVNRKHQIWAVLCVIGEMGATSAELKKDIRLNGVHPHTIVGTLSDFYKEGLIHREQIPGESKPRYRYFATNNSARNQYIPRAYTGGDRNYSRKLLSDAKLNSNGSLTINRSNVSVESTAKSNMSSNFFFQDEEQVLGMIEFLICNIENFTYADELDIDQSIIPKSPIGTDSSFWKSKKTTAKIGSVTPKDIDRKTGYPQLAKTDKRGKK